MQEEETKKEEIKKEEIAKEEIKKEEQAMPEYSAIFKKHKVINILWFLLFNSILQ